MKHEVPSGDLQIAKHEIPSGDLYQLGIPIWRFLLFKRNTRSLLATSFDQYEIPSGDLKQLGIPSGDSFYSKLK
jgi:hypothetical protein